MRKQKHRKAVPCLSHALSHLAEPSAGPRCSESTGGALAVCDWALRRSQSESHQGSLSGALSALAWVREDVRRCLERTVVLHAFA